MDKSAFQSLVREYIKEYSSPRETVKKSELKTVIKECLRVILKEVRWHDEESYKRSHGDTHDPGEETFYKDAQGREDDAARAREDLEIIKKAGLSRQYEALMQGIFDLPIAEFDKRAAAIGELTKKAYQLVGKTYEPLEEMTTTDGGTPGYNIPGWVSRRGGSKRGVEGSRKLGYELTPTGEKEMNRKGDALV